MGFRTVILLLLLVHGGLCRGQFIIKGKVLHSITRQPIEYANIGFEKANIGTISNTDGSFELFIPKSLQADSLWVSSIGFGSKKMTVPFLLQKKEIIIYLNEKIAILAPVSVLSKKQKPTIVELGNTQCRGGTLESDTLYAGRTIALLIDNRKAPGKSKNIFPAFIEKARLRIFRNNLDTCKFRIRILAVDKTTNQPAEDLLAQSVVMQSTMKNGWLEFNLADLSMEVNKPFFLAFEQILDFTDRSRIAAAYKKFETEHPEKIKTDTIEFEGKKVERKTMTGSGIDIAGTFIGISNTVAAGEQHVCYVRSTSFGAWEKVRGIVTATVTLSNYEGQSETSNAACITDTLICKAEKMGRDFIDESGTNGLQIAVSKKGKTVWSTSMSYADVANKKLVTDSTKFRINSISKSFTSLALVQLVAQGKLHLDSPIQHYIPEFPLKPYPITTRQLAGHLAGFRDYREDDPNDYIRTEHFENALQALKIFQDDTLLFKPGSQFYYSSFGWNVIGAIIEKLSDQTYLEYMQQHVFNPIGLHNTCGDNIRSSITNRSRFYDAAGEANDLGDLSYKYAGGGLLSTSHDLLKLGNEVLQGSSISPSSKQLLFQTQHTTDGVATGYGLGWYIGTDMNGHRIWYHSGDSFSSSAHLLIYPDDEMVVAVLTNAQAGVNFDAQKIGELFYKK
ncbi:MAG TPA: serine hydrolase [Phnomibacter sp.]|nr:serine hydrolase [Phnomibacter sp.]